MKVAFGRILVVLCPTAEHLTLLGTSAMKLDRCCLEVDIRGSYRRYRQAICAIFPPPISPSSPILLVFLFYD